MNLNTKRKFKALIACERSGRVRDSFLKRGWEAISCDIKKSRVGGPHYQGNILDILFEKWDIVIIHPPCTFLTRAGEGWMYHPNFPYRWRDREHAAKFFLKLTKCKSRWCIENPVGCMNTRYRKPNQIICPTMFGHREQKRTCFWLNGLPFLEPTKIVKPYPRMVFKSGKSMPAWLGNSITLSKEKRQEFRSVTFQGIADAMSDQWGSFVESKFYED